MQLSLLFITDELPHAAGAFPGVVPKELLEFIEQEIREQARDIRMRAEEDGNPRRDQGVEFAVLQQPGERYGGQRKGGRCRQRA